MIQLKNFSFGAKQQSLTYSQIQIWFLSAIVKPTHISVCSTWITKQEDLKGEFMNWKIFSKQNTSYDNWRRKTTYVRVESGVPKGLS